MACCCVASQSGRNRSRKRKDRAMTTVTARPGRIVEKFAAAPDVSAPPRRHLLDLDDWTPDEMRAILTRASEMRALLDNSSAPRLESLRGIVLVNLFYEN